jgi:3-hydroxy-9,10-secoandrosta-1,3,5(10)-triene-9,17-dione monooxygenase
MGPQNRKKAPDQNTEVGRQPSSTRDLLGRARELVPFLRGSAAEADLFGRLPEEVSDALRREGFLGLQVPRCLGGPEADLRTAFEVYAELARGCGSSAWVAMILSGGSLMASLLDTPAREELWGTDARAAVCSQMPTIGSARREEGGLVISGQWSPTSGVHQAEWAMVSVAEAGPEAELKDVRLAVLPVSSGLVESTWSVTGLRATGSDTISFDAVFVPDHRLLSFSEMLSGEYGGVHPDEPLGGSTVISALTVTVVAPLLGMGEAALEYTLEQLSEASSTSRSKRRRADTASVKSAVADAVSLMDTAKLRAYRALADVERGISERTQLDAVTRSRVHMDAGVAAKNLREAVRLLITALGSASFSLKNPVQRIWRDVEIASTHINVSPDRAREDYGEALLHGERSSP